MLPRSHPISGPQLTSGPVLLLGPDEDITGEEPTTDLRTLSNRQPQFEPELPQEPEKQNGRGLWGGVDLLGAIGLTITASSVVLFAGLFVDAIRDPSSGESELGALAGILPGLIMSLVIVRLTALPTASSLNMLGLATIANVLVHLFSDGGQNELLGLPPSFIESAILSGVPFGIAWLYVARKHRRSLKVLGFVPPSSPTAYLLAFGAWFLALIGVGLWGQLVTDIETITPPDNATPVLEIAGGSLIVAWLLVGLWGPFVEEVFFRGFLLGGLRNRFGPWPALLISSGVFALFHILPGLYVPTFLLGLAFGWVYLKTRSIWPAVFGHTLHNSLVIVSVWQELA